MAIKISNSTIIDDSRNIVSAGIATVSALNISTTEVISSARQLKNIASLDATTTATIETAIANAPNTFTDLNVTGITTFTNGPVFIGAATSTGTASQRLQVTGGAYVSGSVGIGTTRPSGGLHIFDTNNRPSLSSPTLVIERDASAMGDDYSYVEYSNSNLGSVYAGLTGTDQFGISITDPSVYLHIPYVTFGPNQNVMQYHPLLIGTGTSTGTASQRLQVSGGVYVSDNLGIGTTNPTSRLHVIGDVLVSGVTTSATFNTGVIGSQTSGILTTTATTADQVLDSLPTATFQTARYQVSIACTGQLVTYGMTTAFTSIGTITAGAGFTQASYTNVAITGGIGTDARANIGIGLSFNAVGFTSATNLIVTTAVHGLGTASSIAVSFASSIPNSGFTGFAVTAGNIYYAVGVGTTALRIFYNQAGSQVTGIGTTTFTGVGNTMTKAGGVASVEIVSPGSGYVTGNTLSATLGALGSGFSFPASTVVRNYQSTDVMIMQSVGSAATACDYIEYASLANSEILASFGADISGANARLLVTPTYRNNTLKVIRSGITV